MIKLRPDTCQDCRFWVRRRVKENMTLDGCAFYRFEQDPSQKQCEVGIRKDTKEDRMETKEPSEQETREFWEWCGKYGECGYCKGTGRIYTTPDSYSQCRACDGWGYFAPRNIDLNNLFKYAVPKLEDPDIGFCRLDNGIWNVDIEHKGLSYAEEDQDPALALFWAIRQIGKVDRRTGP